MPGGLVVGIQQFHCYNLGSIPHQETEILQATWHSQNKTQKNLFLISWCLKKSLNSMSSYESFFFDCPTHLLSPFRPEAWVLEFWKYGLYNLFNNLLPSIFLLFFFFFSSWNLVDITPPGFIFTIKSWIFIFSFLFHVFCLFVLLSGKFLDWSSKWSIDFIISATVFLNCKSSYFLTVPF